MRQKWLQERLAREDQERRSAERAIELLRKEAQWLRWHEQMPDAGRAFWESKGVPDWAIRYFQLGYCPDKAIWYRSEEYHTPTATIPVFGIGWNLMNVRHRLINPPEPCDKYRPDRAGIPAALYMTDPDKKPSGECVLVEGEIKAIVLRSMIDKDLSIIGTPGKNIKPELLSLLDNCDRIYVILDPDASQQAIHLAKVLGTKRARVVTLPAKADDAFTMYGMTEPGFLSALRCGRVV